MADETTARSRGRFAGLLRHLTERAEREATARLRLSAAVASLLDAPPETPAPALLARVTAACPAIDAAAVLVHDGERWTVRAGVGVPPGPASPGPPADLVAEAFATGSVVVRRGGAAVPPLPPATLAACAVPLRARGALLGVAVFGTRSAPELGPDELAVARVAAERAARTLDEERTGAELGQALDASSRAVGFRDQVLAIVGHDLRNPLGAIVMSAALLQKRGGLEGWQARTVERVRSSALRMGRIINDLLTYTRTRLGTGIPITPRPTELAPLARRMVDELRAAHPEAVVRLEVDGDVTGTWDPDRLEQVISNLVSNAIDHGEEGEPVDVALSGRPGAVAIEVANRGEMPRATLEHAFEAFQRGPEVTGRKASGLGLGLYIAREIVRRHGGDIAIRSAGGETRIAVELPRSADAEAAGKGQHAAR